MSRQFRVLFRLFLFKVVDVELLSGTGDPEKLLGQMATVLASFSFLVSIPVLFVGGRLPQEGARLFEHFFIATTMLVVGLFAVLSWDSVFPERRDVLVLAPMPVAPGTIFLAKGTAIGAGLATAVCALNGISGLLWPWMFSADGSGFFGPFRSMLSFWVTLTAAAVFVFAAVLTMQGAAARVLPRQMFLKLSAVLQVVVFCALVSMYVLEPSLEADAAVSAAANHRLLEWLPSYWFWGMLQQLNGSTDGLPEMVWLAKRAWAGLAIAAIGAVVTVMLAYVGAMRRIVEEPDILPGRARGLWQMRGSASSAVLMFALRTILRSRQHRMILSFYMGAGFGVTLILLRSSLETRSELIVTLLAVSVLMMCTAAKAMRSVFALPMMLRGNWIFRMSALRTPEVYLKAVRRAFLVLAVTPVWCGFAALMLWLMPWREAAAHLALLALLGAMLSDACAGGFRKIPFTCSYEPGRGGLQFAIWGALVLIPLSVLGAHWEWRHLQSAAGQMMFAGALILPAAALRWWTDRRMRGVDELQFEDLEAPAIVSLELPSDAAVLSSAG